MHKHTEITCSVLRAPYCIDGIDIGGASGAFIYFFYTAMFVQFLAATLHGCAFLHRHI